MKDEEQDISLGDLLNQTREYIKYQLNNQETDLNNNELNAFSLEEEDRQLTHLHVL